MSIPDTNNNNGNNQQQRSWCFTLNNPDGLLDFDDFNDARYLIYQEETGAEGTHHLQGYVEFTKPKRLAAVKKILDRAHWEPRRGTREQARDYARKEESRVGGPYEHGVFDQALGERTDLVDAKRSIQSHKRWRDVVNDDELVSVVSKYGRWAEMVFNNRREDPAPCDIILRPWQEEVLGKLRDAPKEREIIWIWSDASTTGKTTFLRHVGSMMDVLPGVWTVGDLIYAYDGHDVIHFNIPRHEEVNETQWKVLETLSDQGKVFSKKYMSCVKTVKSHIVVTTNQSPATARLKLPNRIYEVHVPENDGVPVNLINEYIE